MQGYIGNTPPTLDTDKWKTPNWIYSLINHMVDRCPIDYVEGTSTDSLLQDWKEDSFVNPPYSDPLAFVLKGIKSHQDNKIKVVFLLKVDTTTLWYNSLVNADAHFLYFAERLSYSESRKKPSWSSMLAILSD